MIKPTAEDLRLNRAVIIYSDDGHPMKGILSSIHKTYCTIFLGRDDYPVDYADCYWPEDEEDGVE